MLRIHSLETFGTHEGPGIRLVVFVQGCNFRCAYCHNPDTISATGGKNISVAEIIDILNEQRPYFASGGGLTVSGGEPLLQAKELLELFKEVKKQKFHIALDTNGSIVTADAKKVLDLSDLAIIDLKHFDNEKHCELTGQGNDNVFKTIQYREESGQPFWIRYVLVPGLTDQPEAIEKMVEYLKQFKNLERVEILPYHNLGEYKYEELGMEYRLKGVKSPTPEEISKIENIFKKLLVPIFIRS